ncbi:MAG: pilin [Candidatus Shapirobacteria bacterium]|jgi:hypothetical protein
MVKSFLLFLCLSLPFLSPSPLLAQSDWNNGRCTKTVTTSRGTFDDVATIQGVECAFANVLQVVTYLAGLVFIFMFISGGFNYLFSSGDPKKAAAAAASLTSAFIGLAGVILAWLVLSFIANFTGLPNITKFEIPYL